MRPVYYRLLALACVFIPDNVWHLQPAGWTKLALGSLCFILAEIAEVPERMRKELEKLEKKP